MRKALDRGTQPLGWPEMSRGGPWDPNCGPMGRATGEDPGGWLCSGNHHEGGPGRGPRLFSPPTKKHLKQLETGIHPALMVWKPPRWKIGLTVTVLLLPAAAMALSPLSHWPRFLTCLATWNGMDLS